MQLFDHLPLYAASPEAEAVQDGYQALCDGAWTALQGLRAELFINTADGALAVWEQLYGLETREDSQPERRRERVRAKMRGSGTTTVALVSSVAESFSNGDVQVIEHNTAYYFEIIFISQKGKPPGLDALKLAVEDIKPAHLGVVYVFTMVTHDAITGAAYTHAQLAPHTHTYIREELQTEEDL